MAAIQNNDGASRGHFGSRFGFIMAAAGSAVGVGNIWVIFGASRRKLQVMAAARSYLCIYSLSSYLVIQC